MDTILQVGTFTQSPYLLGGPPQTGSAGGRGPLSRYLPPVPEGVGRAWLQANLPRQAQEHPWIIDPFGAAPRLAVEAARAGYRVLVTANNPIARFLLEMQANPPQPDELRAALADLAAAHKGDERIAPHIRSLYTTACAQCGQMVMADAFLWEREASAPYASLYTCPACGASGEHPANEMDVRRAAEFSNSGLHRARAIERVAGQNDPDREHAEAALSVYPARAVYVLFTLLNKLEGLNLPQPRLNHLIALLLHACDQGNSLWAYPSGRERPLQLVPPPRYREHNLWLALEQGIDRWASKAPYEPLALTFWPQQPPEGGGLCIFEGRLKDLAGDLPSIPLRAALAALPRPNQAFWTLSALWAGWIWGRETTGAFISVLRRKRYDWAWHTAALHAALEHLAASLAPGTPFFGILGGAEAGFLTAALVAADCAGFSLDNLALRSENSPVQITWKRAEGDPLPESFNQANRVGASAASACLKSRGEPAGYLTMAAGAVSGMARLHLFRSALAQGLLATPAEVFNTTQAALKDILTYRGVFFRYGAGESSESGLWWLREAGAVARPLADQVEIALVNYLLQHPGCTQTEMEIHLLQKFAGLLTPPEELILACLESYAEPANDYPAAPSIGWRMRPQDAPAARRAEINQVARQLQALGQRSGFTISDEPTSDSSHLVFMDVSGKPKYWFHIKASAVFGELVHESHSPPERSLIVLPGGRANLVAYKLRYNPHLAQSVEQGWRFLKFRHVRWLLETPLLSAQNFDEQLNADPLTYSAPQMRLL